MNPLNHRNTPRRPNDPQNYPIPNQFFPQNPSQYPQNPSQYPQNFSQFPLNMYPNPQQFGTDPSFFQQFMMQNQLPQSQNFQNVEGSCPDSRQVNVDGENNLDNNEDVAEIDPMQFTQFEVTTKKSWQMSEDAALISAYMNVTTDPIVGTGQKISDLWKKVGAVYKMAQQDNRQLISARNNESLKGRWRRICAAVTKWVGCMDEANKRMRSGMNDEDIIREAHIIYNHQYNGHFAFFDHWKMLRKYPKWETCVGVSPTPTSNIPDQPARDSGSSGKRARLDDDDEIEFLTPLNQKISSQFHSEEVEFGSSNRPEGVKKAKSIGKKKVDSQTSLFANKLEVFGSSIAEKLHLDQEKLKKKEALQEKKQELQEKHFNAQMMHDKFTLFAAYAARGEDNLSDMEKKIYLQLAKELGYDI